MLSRILALFDRISKPLSKLRQRSNASGAKVMQLTGVYIHVGVACRLTFLHIDSIYVRKCMQN